MKTTIKLAVALMVAIASAVMCSCSNDETQFPDEEIREGLSQDVLNITYNGKTYYNILTTYDENGDFIFHNEELAEIYQQDLKNLETLSFNFIDETNIEIYKSLNENLESHGIIMPPMNTTEDASTRTEVSSNQNFLGTVELFDDKKFKDRHYTFGILDARYPYSHSNLKNYNGFNDKCSSLKLINYLPKDASQILNMGTYTLKYTEATLVFIGYEDRNYGKKTFTVLADASVYKELSELKGFNDKMSSIKLFYARTGIYTSEGVSK